ncbi:Uncharacterized protein FWK35_00025856, partial [Aphis craccivora]
IFELSSLLHTKIRIEEPYKSKVISQCLKCQQYGHTRAYCGYHPRCVRCAAGHQTSDCPNPRDAPPKCALCSENHPANYKGCSIYRELQRRKKPTSKSNIVTDNIRYKSSNVQSSHPSNDTLFNKPPYSDQRKSYAHATSNQTNNHAHSSNPIPPDVDLNKIISSFLEEFKSLINPLLSLLTKFNANGLKNHVHELELILNNKRIDVALITETHFTEYTKIFIPGYKLIHTNHPDNTAHGGVAIYIKSNIMFQLLPSFSQDFIQSCAIAIKLNDYYFTIAALYAPPKHNITFSKFSEYFNTIKNNFIIGGDYNAKHQAWGCRTNNPRGTTLHNFTNTKKFKISAPPGPTYWPSSPQKNPDILDIFVTKIPNHILYHTSNLLDLNSDHSAVLLTLNASPTSHQAPLYLFNRSTNIVQFQETINENIKLNIKLKTPHDIDSAVNNLTKIIQTAAWSATNLNLSQPKYNPIPEQIRIKIVEKRRARALYQRTRLPSHKQSYNRLSNSLSKLIAKHKNTVLTHNLTNLTQKDGSLWKSTKKVLRYKASNLPLKKSDGSLTTSDTEKAELFRQHLSEIFQPHSDIVDIENTNIVNSDLNTSLQLSPPIKSFSPNDIKYLIHKFPLNKSPGFDLITAEVARNLPKRAIVHLAHIYNSILRLSYFPVLWKFSNIIMIQKPNKPPDSTSSYRPISLLPLFAKILERLLLKRIVPLTAEKQILPDYQFGFRTSHSTTHQVHRLVDAISYSLEKKLYCTCAFLDISQAFDRVWHQGLLYKLKSFLPSSYFSLIKSYLTDRSFKICFGTATSEIASINAGVPQGAHELNTVDQRW